MAVAPEREWGEIAILINSAGMGRDNPLEPQTPGENHGMVNTNLKGTILVTRAILGMMGLPGHVDIPEYALQSLR